MEALLHAQLILKPVLRRSVLVLMQLMLVKPSQRHIKASPIELSILDKRR